MLSTNQQNSPEEVEALRILNAGYLPEIQESEFIARWLPLLSGKDWRNNVNAWVYEVAKSAQQRVRVLRGATEVAVVPAIFARWPTEIVADPRASISELTAVSDSMSARIPISGITNLRNGLLAQFDRVNDNPAVTAARDAHEREWLELFAFFGVKPSRDFGDLERVIDIDQQTVELGELLIDEEL